MTAEKVDSRLPIEAPKDRRGRVRWSVLKRDPDLLTSYIEQEAGRFVRDGRLVQTDFETPGNKGLGAAVARFYPNGFFGLKENLGVPTDNPARPRTHSIEDGIPRDQRNRILWSALEPEPDKLITVIENQAREHMDQGHPVSQKGFAVAGKTYLNAAIKKYYKGGYFVLKQRLTDEAASPLSGENEEPLLPRDGRGRISWETLKQDQAKLSEYIESEVKSLMEENPNLTTTALRAARKGDLAHAIHRYYPGGMKQLRKNLKPTEEAPKPQEPKERPQFKVIPQDAKGIVQWSKLNTDPGELQSLIEQEVGLLIAEGKEVSYENIDAAGMRPLSRAIITFYPGRIYGLRNKLGIKSERKSFGHWSNPQVVLKEATTFYQEEGEISAKLLTEKGRMDLLLAIGRSYPGKLTQLKKDLAIVTDRKSANYWNKDTVEQEARAYMDGGGKLTKKALGENNKSGLGSAITLYYPGGMRQLKIDLGLDDGKRKPLGFWTQDRIEDAVREFLTKHGRISFSLLKLENRLDLAGAISTKYRGSMTALSEKFGFSITSEKSTLISTEQANAAMDSLFEEAK